MNGNITNESSHNWYETISRPGILLLMAFLAIILNGCQPTDSAANKRGGHPPKTFADDISAQQIFSSMLKKYRSAARYSDRAVLYMSYRLNGRAIQEPQPWSIAINEKGCFSADLFNAQVRCDGKLFSCYVYDIESGNLDDQRLLLPVNGELPIKELYDDKIARHFIAGYSEMPLVEDQLPSQPPLVPPTVGLLTGKMEPGWLRPDVRLERYDDSEIDGRACFVLRCWQSSKESDFVDLWIDKDTFTIWQTALPLDCLAEKVRTSPEIENLRLVARFHDATFDQQADESRFALKPRPEATPVSQFVKIPEPLNSELIGMKTPDFELRMQSGRQLSRADFAGRPTALLWIAGDPDEAIRGLDKLKSSLPPEKANFGVVYSDRDLADPDVKGNVMNMQLNDLARETTVPFYYDPELNASMQLAIKMLPCVVVLDKDSTIQFAIALADDQWPSAVKAAIERVGQGEDVGSEMLSEYEKFLETYHQRLVAVSAAKLLTDTPAANSSADGKAAAGGLIANRTWTNSQFKRAGNIVCCSDGNEQSLYVFDGYRTVVELNTDGKIVARHELQLPENEAVGVLRAGLGNTGRVAFATFMPLGKAVYLFDEKWQLISSYPPSSGEPIRDVQMTNDGNMLIALAGSGGIHRVDIPELEGTKIHNLNASSINRSGLDAICDGAFVQVQTGKQNAELAAWQLSRFGNSQSDASCCLGTDKDGGWHLIGIDGESVGWTAAIGPQLFDHNIEPISSTAGPEPCWAVANSDGVIHIFSHLGSWLGDFRSDSDILGEALVETDGQLRLIVSTKQGVTNWNLDINEASARAARAAKRRQ